MRADWGLLYANDAGIASRSPSGSTKMLVIVVEASAAFGLTAVVREKDGGDAHVEARYGCTDAAHHGRGGRVCPDKRGINSLP